MEQYQTFFELIQREYSLPIAPTGELGHRIDRACEKGLFK